MDTIQPFERDYAEGVAIRALAWMATQEGVLEAFLGSTGASVDDLRGAAQEPAFLIAVLDFLMMDDAWVTGFCDADGIPYDHPHRARQSLPGGATEHWT